MQREIGYRATMTDLGLTRQIHVIHAEQTSREIQTAARVLLTSARPPEAIFCWTDFVALEVMSVAPRPRADPVPEDVAVVGFDSTTYCDLAQDTLTSNDQSGQVLGLQAARLLTERIDGRTTPEHFVVAPRLVVRASSRARLPTCKPARKHRRDSRISGMPALEEARPIRKAGTTTPRTS